MIANDESQRFAVVWQTIAAVIFSFVVWIVASLIANALEVIGRWFEFGDFGEKSPLVALTRATIPNMIGIMCAKVACDRFLTVYSRRSVFLFFVLVAIAAFLLIFVPNQGGLREMEEVVSALTIGASAYYWFWKNRSVYG